MTASEIKQAHPLDSYLIGRGVVLTGAGAQKTTNRCAAIQHKPGHQCVSVDTAKGIWHCNDCDTGGTIIDWMMIEQGKSLADVLQNLNGAVKSPAPQKPSFDWLKCVSALTADAKRDMAVRRGYSLAFVDWLHQEEIIGNHKGWIAFAVQKSGAVIGCHYRLYNCAKHWCYHPEGNGTQPLVFGDPAKAVYVLVFESQWDAFAVMDKLFWHTARLDDYAIFITRGAENGNLIKGRCSPDAVVYAFVQNDKPDKKGKIAAETWLSDIARFAGCKAVLRVTTPAPHKDINDWTRAGAGKFEIEATILAAKPVAAPENTDTAPVVVPAEVKPLPAIVDGAYFVKEKIEPPAELIAGIFHQGSKMAFGGGSKTFKTWTLLDLALSIAAGEPWLSFKTKKGRVLFLNFEIQPAFFQQRIRAIADAKQIALVPGMIDLWNLRGQAAGYASIFPRILERVKDSWYALIVLDPIYKCYGDVDENSAGAVAGLMNAIEALTVETGAATAFGAHYSKGNQSGKDSIDRISGSGVFGRDPDSILNFTRHEEQDAFTVEMTLRNFKPVDPFVARWLYPLMRRDESLDPAKLKKPPGRTPQHSGDDILKLLAVDGLTATKWERAAEKRGISRRTFYRLKNALEDSGQITLLKDKWTPAKT